MARVRRLTWISVIALWAVATSFNRLGAPPVYMTNEAREGVFVRAMLQSGNFLLPLVANHVEKGELFHDKPPLFHWVSAAATWVRAELAGRALGPGEELSASFDEWALRFPSALAGCVMALAIATLGAGFVGERAACLAAAALLTSWQFNFQVRFGRVDMTFACLVTLAVLAAGRAILEPRPDSSARRLVALAGLASGLAMLTKGTLGILLPALACGAGLLLQSLAGRAVHPAARLPWMRAMVVAAVVAIPWYAVTSAMSGGAVLRAELVAQNFDKFIGPDASMPPWYYLRPWLLDSFPWNLIALAGVVAAWRRGHRGALFCAVWWLTILAFFQIAAYKRRAYLLPALPAEALLAGWFLDACLLGGAAAKPLSDAARLALPRAALAIAACTAAALLGWLVPPVFGSTGVESSWTQASFALGLVAVAVVIHSAVLLVRAIRSSQGSLALIASWLLLAAFYVGIRPTAETVLANRLSPKRLADRIESEIPAGHSFTMCGIGDHRSLMLLLYAKHPEQIWVVPEPEACAERPPAGFYLLPEPEWQRLGEKPGAPRAWRERFRGEIRGWTARIPVVLAERLPAVPGPLRDDEP